MITFTNRTGLRLAADTAGQPGAPPVILLHGGGQTRHSWGTALAALGQAGFHAITVDLRGHGDSDRAADGDYGLGPLRDDLLDIIAQLPPGPPPALIGASLGGLISLLVAGSDTPTQALVLVDVVPQLEPEGVAEILGFMNRHTDGFATVADAADAVASYLPHRKRPKNTTGLAKNLRLQPDGRYYWHWDPKMLGNTDIGQWRQKLDDAARAITVPTLLVRGALSRVVSPAGADALRALIPHCDFVDIARADHMVAGDDNDAFNAPLLGFLQAARPAASPLDPAGAVAR